MCHSLLMLMAKLTGVVSDATDSIMSPQDREPVTETSIKHSKGNFAKWVKVTINA